MRLLLSCFLVLSAMACTSKSDNPAKPGGGGGGAAMKELEASDIAKRTYSLKKDLNFADAERIQTIGQLQGTEVLNFSFKYYHNRLFNHAEAENIQAGCAFYVERPLGGNADNLKFRAHERLLTGTMVKNGSDDAVDFSLQLQGERFESFMLFCQNVTSVEGILEHIGDYIDVK